MYISSQYLETHDCLRWVGSLHRDNTCLASGCFARFLITFKMQQEEQRGGGEIILQSPRFLISSLAPSDPIPNLQMFLCTTPSQIMRLCNITYRARRLLPCLRLTSMPPFAMLCMCKTAGARKYIVRQDKDTSRPRILHRHSNTQIHASPGVEATLDRSRPLSSIRKCIPNCK